MRGSYILIMRLKKDSKMRVGSLGLIDFPKGYYCYVGSALGSAVSLESRIRRHKRLDREKRGKLRWHIDYFLINPNTSIVQTIMVEDEKKMECEISKMLEKVAKSSVQGFGCSDCECRSHFHYLGNKEGLKKIAEKVQK